MKHRWSLPVLGALAFSLAACGRSDDSADTTAAATTAPAATTAAPATEAPADTTAAPGGDTTAPGGDATAPAATTAAPTTTEAPAAGTSRIDISEQCASEPLTATEVGISADEIVIEVMADTGSPLAPGLFQANIDGVKAYAEYVNSIGGVGCRQLVVREWDSKLDPTEAKNGQIDACANAVAMVGGNALFNPDVTAMVECKDLAGNATGLPDIAAIATDTNELCAPTTFTIQQVKETCPITLGEPREFTELVGPFKRLAEAEPGLHGIFMVAGDLPTTRQSAVSQIHAQESVGITFDATPIASGRDEQAAFTPKVQLLKQNGGNFVYDGLDEQAMLKLKREANAQGLDPSTVHWTCGLACYTRDMLTDPTAAEGTVVWMSFLPFEEADTNADLQAYLDTVGADKAESFGAQGWQSAAAFQQVVDQIVAEQGPNALTRAAILEGLTNLEDFTSYGWTGARTLRSISPCYMTMQVQDGEFVRTWPEERGTLDCSPDNLTKVTAEPVSEAAAFG